MEFKYQALPVQVVFGLGTARHELGAILEDLGLHRVLLVVSAAEEPLARRLVAPASDRVAEVFTDVHPHVPVSVAEAARVAARKSNADGLLSVGGGSTTGTAKAIALATELPIVAVPTTYAGSEMTPVWGMTEAARKTTGRDLRVLPRVVVYDPTLTTSLPPGLSVASGLNAVAHCVEAFWGPHANPISSLMAEDGIRALASGLPGVMRDPGDLESRSDVLYGAWLAGTVFATAGAGLHHKICHVLGGAYDLPHAETHAVVLPHATALVTSALPEADARISTAVGAPAGQRAGTALAELARGLGAPLSLREIGMAEPQLLEAVRLVAEQLPTWPEPELRALLEAAWRGELPTPVPAAGASA
jgi:maleylacetate reductase